MITLIYLIKVIVCACLFTAYYFLALRNKHFHQFNRFYILTSTVLSVVLPLITVPLSLFTQSSNHSLTQTLSVMTMAGWEREFVVKANTTFLADLITRNNIISGIYAIGLLFFVTPFIKDLLAITTLSRKYEPALIQDIRFYNTVEPGTPFSFFNAIFWNRSIDLESIEGQYILRHEQFHIRARHSYDIIFMQLVCCLLWFIPLFYLMKRELKVVHEFLADEYAATGNEKHHYAELLVMHALSSKQINISNQFFFTQIKRRINMILQHARPRYSYIQKGMTLLVVLFVFWACSSKNKDVIAPLTIDNDITFTKVETEASFPGGAMGWVQFLNKTFRYPQEAQDKEIQGTVVIQFTVEKDGSLGDFRALKGPAVLSDEALRILRMSGKWIPARQNGHVVRSYRKQPITFKLEAE